MITVEQLADLRDRFDAYVKGHLTGDENYDRSIRFKQDHTKRVVDETAYLCRGLGLDGVQCRLAEVCALYHDIGRFEQLKRYNTFSDSRSESHGCLGARVIRENKIFEQLDESDRETAQFAVKHHNMKTIPTDAAESSLFYTRLVRDADKLDIFHIFSEYYIGRHDTNEVLIHDLPDTPDATDAVCRQVIEGKLVDYHLVKTLNDFKIMQLGMVFDINFHPAFTRIKDRNYFNIIAGTLPRTDMIKDLVSRVNGYLKKQIKAPL